MILIPLFNHKKFSNWNIYKPKCYIDNIFITLYIYTHTPCHDEIFFFFFFVVGLKYSLIINLLLQCQETCSSFGWYLLPFQSLDIHGSEPPLPNYWIIKKKTSTPNIIFLSMLHKLNRWPPPPNYQENLPLMPHMPALMTHLLTHKHHLPHIFVY